MPERFLKATSDQRSPALWRAAHHRLRSLGHFRVKVHQVPRPSMRTLGTEVACGSWASQRSMEVSPSRSRSMTLLYSAAVGLQVRLVGWRGLSVR
jgi:hypothetical protein